MKMFARDDELAELESLLAASPASARLPLAIARAWHLRQRDTQHALQLVQELQAELALSPADTEHAGYLARLQLIQAEAHWLYAAFDAAQICAEAARQQFLAMTDRVAAQIGCCDCHWLLAAIALDMGQHQASHHALQAAATAAQMAGDDLRLALCEAAQARWAVMADARTGENHWRSRLNYALAENEVSLAAWVEDFLALCASKISDFSRAALHFMQAHQAALQTGQLRAAIIDLTNLGEDFAKLNDHHAALEQMQRALELARPTCWPRSVGACLMHTADTMRQLNRLEAAQELLEEALQVMRPLAAARSYAHALQYMGDLALARQEHARALDCFIQLEQRADALQQSDFKGIALRGQAHALAALGEGEAAQGVAQRGLRLWQEQGDLHGQIASLQVLAEIHARYALPLDEACHAASHSLHFLQLALQVAGKINGYTLPSSLLDMLAREYARVGQYEYAYQIALEASATRERTHDDQATNRAIAMQITHQTERARAEGEYHRQLAAAEARRAAILQQNSAMLTHLSAVGQEITVHLEADTVVEVLHRHVQNMLPSTSFTIYLASDDGRLLRRFFGIENGQLLPQTVIGMDDGQAPSARCARERCEILLNTPQAARVEEGAYHSALFGPLVVHERLLGVMAVQADTQDAYGEQERLVFRTLSAYGAIALDNADAYQRLQEAQKQLVSQEKLAALGSLVAGVAHELNTPIGNSLTIASTLQGKSQEMENKIVGPGVKRSELLGWVQETREASQMMVRGLCNAAELLHSFKQVAMDRTSAHRRPFDLLQTSQEIVATMMNQIRRAGHQIEVAIPAGIRLDSYPGPYGQVITNFINNALLHAFDTKPQGLILLQAQMQDKTQVRIEFRDNGQGMSAEHLKRIFEPFFTTKLGQGGSGLGLSISYNIVTSILHGQISVRSTPDVGTCFTLELPLVVPDQTQ